MTLVEYINGLIQDGTWSSLSSEAQSIFLLIHAKYKGDPIKLSYRSIQESTGVSKSIVKAKLQELADSGLIHIDPDTKAIKPTAELSDEGLPIPPEDPEQDSGEYVDLLRWVKEWISTPWGAALGGAVLFYLIKLWMEYIESQQAAKDPFHDWPSFVAQANTQDYGFESLLKVAENPMQMTPQELSQLLDFHP